MNLKELVAVFVFLLCAHISSAQLSAAFSADKDSGCAPIRIVFSDESTGGATSWKWDLGNGIVSNAQNPSTTYFTPGSYTIKLTIYNGADSTEITKNNYIVVSGTALVKFGAVPFSGCSPFKVQFADSSVPSSSPIIDWQWDFGDGNIGTGKAPEHIYYAAGKFSVTLTVNNSVNCLSTTSQSDYITVFDSVSAKFSSTESASCTVPVSVQFNDNSTGSNINSWIWDFGDGHTATGQNPINTYTKTGAFAVSLIIKNDKGCIDTAHVINNIQAGNYAADFTVPPSVCLGKPVSFVNSSTPLSLLDSSKWVLGDGMISALHNPTVAYTSLGQKSITLTVYFGNCSATVTKAIQVIDAPVAKFTATPTGSCKPPLTVKFTNATVGGTVVMWLFGDGQTSTDISPSHTYTAYGNYHVRLIVQNANGCLDTLKRLNYISISQPIINKIKDLPYSGCSPWTNNFKLDVNTADSITKYQWDFGDNTFSTLSSPTHTYPNVGLYKVSIIITTASGCADTLRSTVEINTKPVPNFGGGPHLVCPKDVVNFTDSSSANTNQWLWLFGDGGSSTEQNPTYNYNDTGWMNVKLIAYNGGCSDSFEIKKFIYVNPPIARFKDSFVCGNQKEHFLIDHSIGATFWEWDINGLANFQTKDVHYVFSDTGVYNISLLVKDKFCEHKVQSKVLILDEKADFITIDTGTCRNTNVTLIAQGIHLHTWNIKNYKWEFEDGVVITTDTPVVVRDFNFLVETNVKVTLTITDLNDCTSTLTKTVTVHVYGPQANFGKAFTAACAGSMVSFTDSSLVSAGSPITRWVWYFGDGKIKGFTSPPFEHVYDSAGLYDVRLSVYDSLGCKDDITRLHAVAVYKPNADFYTTDTMVCVGSLVRFKNASTGVRLQNLWDFGNDLQGYSTDTAIRYTQPGIYDIKLLVTDSAHCISTQIKQAYITVANAKADFEITDSSKSCPVWVIGLTNRSVNNLVNNWSFDNGNTSSLVNPSVTYTLGGNYNVKLKIIGNGGCIDSISKVIKIDGPSGRFAYGPLESCPPLKVNFMSHAQKTDTYTWDFSDGQSSYNADSATSHVYTTPGYYIPKLILEDAVGCRIPIVGLDTIKIKGAKALIKSIPRFSFCDSANISFFDSTITNDVILSYKWDFGDGTQSSTRNPVHSFTKAGTYKVSFEVRTVGGCVSVIFLPQPIVIAITPKLSLAAVKPLCLPAKVQFNGKWLNADTSTISWYWNYGNGTHYDELHAPAVSFGAGTYTITLTGTNLQGCADTVQTIFIAHDTPHLVVTPGGQLCLGDSIRLSATGGGTYIWDSNPSLSCTHCPSPMATPASDQLYKITSVTSQGCSSYKTILVRVKIPGYLRSGPGDTLCVGRSTILEASGTEIYLWRPSDGLSSVSVSNPTARPLNTTNYMVIGTDSLNCFADTGHVLVVVYPIPEFDIAEDKLVVSTGTIVPLHTRSSADITSWRWSPTTGLSCTTCPQPVLTVWEATTYTATVTNEGRCQAQDRVTIVPLCNGENVFIPNTFSPNDDGNNDIFYMRGKGLGGVKNLRIFNRWGELLFEKKDFALNNPSAGWDGTYKGKKLSPDVYVFVADMLCDKSMVLNLKGNITLLQ